ncbi:hypothetical protein L249_5723 [Ophiocordyceps polyrhachis-furcata BCC 54312]|uniref:Uncharacterized protein n=1 Tax=Ophiocordyceps polyrhachis-furcata BCC 54312 TaxID=1330021 RepID=A0A367L032_9HYPO|nr:hypothetical protein L249_5723 [Ophiocordyceps polyrhachis-furcata BCC 54312]
MAAPTTFELTNQGRSGYNVVRGSGSGSNGGSNDVGIVRKKLQSFGSGLAWHSIEELGLRGEEERRRGRVKGDIDGGFIGIDFAS